MVSLMQRRREMILQSAPSPTPYWDYEWDYTMGKLDAQTGWATDSSGTSSSTLISDGEKFTANNSSFYQAYIVNGGDLTSLRKFTDGYGTIEVVCYGVWNNATSGTRTNLRIHAVKDSTNRLCVFPANGKWRLYKASGANTSQTANTAIANCSNNTEYTVKIVLRDTVADVYINGTKVVDSVEATAAAGASNGILYQNGGGSSYYGVIKSLKIHNGAG